MEQFFKDPQILRQMGELLDDFSSYLRQERALAPTTVANYVYLTKKFLTHRFGAGPADLSDLTAVQVVGSVRRLVPSLCRKRAKVMTSALRLFLRYARYQDFIRSDLAACVPCVADWSVASIPKGLPIAHVKRVLASCNRSHALPLRYLSGRFPRKSLYLQRDQKMRMFSLPLPKSSFHPVFMRVLA
jgi:site-specific recombinase XerC